ncbi:MAG: rhodanese-like domain-containing protein [Thermomicrobiales bacterium]|nr:rhodanese-like domain-containing protein [Thermomicrobiales bacterium]
MPRTIDRHEVQRLIREEGATLIDALPRADYDAEHVAGAISLPIKELNARTTAHLSKHDPMIVYCWDMQ